MTASTRRAALGAILAAPLASVPAVAATQSVSAGLTRLIAKHDRINEMLFSSESDDGYSFNEGLMRAAAAMRGRVLSYPAQGLPDILAKVECLARLWPLDELRKEVAKAARSGHVTIDDMAEGIVLELALLGEGAPRA